MYPYDPNKPSYDPCELVRTADGCLKLRELMKLAGYVVPERLFRAFVVCARLRKPMMLAGKRGGGKSKFPLVLYRACNVPLFWLQCREGMTADELLYSWNRDLQTQFVLQAVGSRSMEFDEAFEKQWERRFLKAGKPAAAFEFAAEQARKECGHRVRPIFVMDEEDKLGETGEDMLLEPLEFGRVTVEGYKEGYLGFGPDDDRRWWPLVFVATNDLRNDASSPFRSRFYFFPVDLPDEATQIEILRVNHPVAAPDVVKSVMRIFAELQVMTGFRDKPNIREAVDVAAAFIALGVERVDEGVIEDFAGLLAKRQQDFEIVSKPHVVKRLVLAVERENRVLDELVDASFAARCAGSMAGGEACGVEGFI